MADSTRALLTFAPGDQARRAQRDWYEAIKLSRFWMMLGWQDVLQRYRGSMLGPFWFTLTTAVFIGGLGPLYAALFSLNTSEYLPFMALGVTTWQFVTGTINDASNTFIASGHLMKQLRLPRLMLLFRVIWRNVIIFLHNLPIYIVVLFWFKPPLGWGALAVIPGFILVCLNLVWMGLMVAILCARYRDVPPIIGSILQIGFFVTPVMWDHKMQAVNPMIVNLNPLAAMIELIRAPLMGGAISLPLLLLALGWLVIGSSVTAAMFVRCRRQIVFWA